MAIVLWNTAYLSRAVETLRPAGIEVPGDPLAHIWPLAWGPMLLTGDYRWSPDTSTSADTLRPLRFEQL